MMFNTYVYPLAIFGLLVFCLAIVIGSVALYAALRRRLSFLLWSCRVFSSGRIGPIRVFLLAWRDYSANAHWSRFSIGRYWWSGSGKWFAPGDRVGKDTLLRSKPR